MIRVLKGHPWHAPRNRRPVCASCARPATKGETSVSPITTLKLDGTIKRGQERSTVFYCDEHAR